MAILDSVSVTGKKEMEALAKKFSNGNTVGREMISYKVKSGDVLSGIAIRHKVRADDIRKWNNLRSDIIRSGQRLAIWVPVAMIASAKLQSPSQTLLLSPDAKTYTVQPGDTLWDISKKVPGLTIEKIKNLNKLKDNTLKPGQKLILG